LQFITYSGSPKEPLAADMAFNADAVLKALIQAAVKLKLRAQIKVSFFFGWAIPIAVTALILPTPYNQIFFSVASALLVIGAIALVASLFME
jgi:hypothetical protein